MKKVLHRIDSRTNNGNHLRSHLRAVMALDHSCLGLENESLENNIRPNFLRSTSLINKILPTTLGACKPTLHTFYTLHLLWNSNMRRCFYHTDLRQNAVFHISQDKLHSFSIQNRMKHTWTFSKTVQKISKIT